jgi:hypothetical protein
VVYPDTRFTTTDRRHDRHLHLRHNRRLHHVVGITSRTGAYAWWIALVVGLIMTVFTALTGLADWLTLEWGSEIWKTATTHMLSMVSATVLFALAGIFGQAR